MTPPRLPFSIRTAVQHGRSAPKRRSWPDSVSFLAGLLALAVAAGLHRLTLVTGCLALAVLAGAVGGHESRDLWDYLVDPWSRPGSAIR